MEGYEKTTVVCKKCHTKQSLHNMTYSEDGNDLICSTCYEKPPLINNPFKQKRDILQERELARSSSHKTHFVCDNCGFEFSRNMQWFNYKCPNCNTNRIHLHSTGSDAAKILKESVIEE